MDNVRASIQAGPLTTMRPSPSQNVTEDDLPGITQSFLQYSFHRICMMRSSQYHLGGRRYWLGIMYAAHCRVFMQEVSD
jgi:hypothetical protein